MSPRTCPACGRPNGPHRKTCLYCATALPEAAAGELPPDLDALVRQAMKGGDVGRLRAAFGAESRPPTTGADPVKRSGLPPPSRRQGPPVVARSADPVPPRPAVPPLAVPAAPPPPQDLPRTRAGRLRALSRAAEDAALADEMGEEALAETSLTRARALLDLLQDVGERHVDPPVALPPFRRPAMLALWGPGDAAMGPQLAPIIGVDVATARMAAVSRGPRVILRGDALEELQGIASSLRAAGFSAAAVDRPALLDMGPAAPMLRTCPAGLVVGRAMVWDGELEPADGAGHEVSDAGVTLLVPGEIEVRRWRHGVSSGERRLAVVDLHAPGLFVRVVEGLSELDGLPGHVTNAARRSLRAMSERASERWPSARVCASWVARSPTEAPMGDELEAGAPAVSTGWAAWEQHTRLARALVGVVSRDSVG